MRDGRRGSCSADRPGADGMNVLRALLAVALVLTLLTGCFQHVNLTPRPPKPVGVTETGKWAQLIARTDPEEFDGSRVVVFGDVDHYGKPVIRYAYEQCADRQPMIRDGRIYVIHVEAHNSSMYVVECN
jgi:hypothetical protein